MKLVLKIIILVICVFTFLNAIVFVGLSVERSIHVYSVILQGTEGEHPGLHLAESLDGFLLAIVFLIFAIGIGKLFVPDMKILRNIQLPWLEPKNFAELKHTLWLAILTTLVVLFASSAVLNMNQLKWELLVLPISITLIAVGLKMLR